MNNLFKGNQLKRLANCTKCVGSVSSNNKRALIYSSKCLLASNGGNSNGSISSVVTNWVRCLSTPEYKSPACVVKDSISEDVLSLKSCDDVMNYFKTLNPEALTPDHTWLVLNHAFEVHYKDLWKRYTWLHANIHIEYIQFVIQNRIEEFTKCFTEHESFPMLLELLTDHCKVLDSNKLSESLLSLIYMGVPFYNPIVHKYLARIHDETHLLDPRSLATLSHMLKSLPAFHYSIMRKMMSNLKLFLSTNDSPSLEEVYFISNVVINLIKFFTKDTSEKFIVWFTNSTKNFSFADNPEYLGTFVRLNQIFIQTQPHARMPSLDTIESLIEKCKEHVKDFESFSITEVCRSLKFTKKYGGTLSKLMEKRSFSLLSETTRISDLVNLICSLSKTTPYDVTTSFESHLLQKMSDSNVQLDVLLLSNIADSLLDLSSMNKDILRIYHKLVVANADTIVTYISRFNRICKLLIKHPFTDQEDESEFVRAVVKHFDGAHGVNFLTTTCLGLYLLTLQNYTQIPNHTYLKLISSLTKFTSNDLYILLRYLNGITNTCQGEQRIHFMELLGNVQQILLNKARVTKTLDSVYSATLAVVVQSKYRNPSMSEFIMELYTPLSENLDQLNIGKMAKFVSMANYHIPQVFENLVNYAINNSAIVSGINVMQVLDACSKVGYRPKEMAKFYEVIRDFYLDELNDKKYNTCLMMLNNLAALQFFPEDELLRMFSLDIIQDIESFIEEKKDYDVEDMLMKLNRSVVLDCPQLDIPWFHEQYCKDDSQHSSKHYNRNKESLIGDIYSTLTDVLGGSKYILRESMSPYYYEIDFECALDIKNRPCSAATLKDDTHKTLQRIAILVQHEMLFCRHSKILLGSEQMKKRHLEILKYKIVEVPFFEWYSMGLSERVAKIKYLKNKIDDTEI